MLQVCSGWPPITVYVDQFSAHPLESDSAELYGPPDGYLDDANRFHRKGTGPADRPVYEIQLLPEDGLYRFPTWLVRPTRVEDEAAFPGAP